mmetsp:Transcript_107131/g.160198  ORF Transcript_107131/g.160198 Transcript_107131/m.160198 type:complete len:80 (+) Transcript_107131:2-241(+)
MDQNMMEHGNKEKKMEKEYTHLQMDRYLMLDILKMNSKIVRHLLMLAEKNMLVNGKMICIMEKESWFILTEKNMMDFGL